MSKIVKAVALMFALLATQAHPGRADVQGDMMRSLVGKYGASVVTLRMVLKSAAGGGSDQAQIEANGIVIDASGLVATTNTAIDPASMYAGMMGGDSAEMATSIVSARIRLSSGEELPARVVLRDRDRNLAFVRPIKRPAKPLTAVNFRGKSSARLGEAITIVGRLGKAGSRQSQAIVQRVVGVVDKPRRLYVLEPYAYVYLGNVVFNEAGQPLGLLSMRVVAGGRGVSSLDSFLAVVIPMSDVWDVALQAPQAKDVRPTKAAPATTKTSKTTSSPKKTAPPAAKS